MNRAPKVVADLTSIAMQLAFCRRRVCLYLFAQGIVSWARFAKAGRITAFGHRKRGSASTISNVNGVVLGVS